MARRVQLRRDTAANWAAVDPILAQGEVAVVLGAKDIRIGDGVSTWSALPRIVGSLAVGVEEIADEAVTVPKMPRSRGFVSEQIDRAHRALAWGPNNEILAAVLSNTGGRTLEVSTDDMATWTAKTAPDAVLALDWLFVTAAGSLIAVTGNKVYRSIDLGTTWALVHDLGANVTILGNGWTEGPAGTMYLAGYTTTAGAYPAGAATIYVSTNDGAAWAVHSSFPSSIDGAPAGGNTIRHLHSIHALASGLYCTTGDNATEAGIWKFSAGTWVRQTPADANAVTSQRWRTVSLQERGGRIYWGKDTGGANQGEIGSAPVADLGNYTRISSLPTGVFYSASLPDGMVLFGGSAEQGAADEDQYVRLWGIDTADRLWELWKNRKHTSAVGAGQFGVVNNLDTSSTGRVLFAPKNIEGGDAPGGTFSSMAVVGRVQRGVRGEEVRKPAAPIYGGRTWQSTATTSSPSTTSLVSNSGAAVIPEMDLLVPCTGVPLLILFSGTFTNTLANSAVLLGISLDGAAPTAEDTRFINVVNNGKYEVISVQRIWTPGPGLRRVNMRWWAAASGGTVTNSGLTRRLSVVELGG